MPQEPEKIKKVAKKVTDQKGSVPLAILEDTTDISEKLDTTNETLNTVLEAVQSLPEPIEPTDYDDSILLERLDALAEEIKKKDFFDQQTFNDIVDTIESRITLPQPLKGDDGKTPKKGVDYFDGYTPRFGIDYFNGNDGSPDTGDQIITKINDSEGFIDSARIKGIETFINKETLDKNISVLNQQTSFLINKINNLGNTTSSGGGVWGTITGTLSDQTDLQAALDLKAPLTNPHFISTGGFWITPTPAATSILLFDNITGTNAIDLQVPITGTWTINMPNKSGTLAVTSDIGIKTLGGLSGAIQTFSGSGISIVSSGTNHAFTNDGVLSLNSPTGTITLSASTGAIDADVNQASSYSWSGDHTFTSNIDFTPVDSTSQFFDMNPDSSASVPSRLRFWNAGGAMSSFEVNTAQGKDIQYILPKDEPVTGGILKVSNWSAPVAELEWGSAAGDVVGPASAASNEMAIFDGSTGKLIQGITAVTAGTVVTIGTNSVIYPNENVISVGTVSSTYTGSFAGSTNGANGLDIYNSNVGTSKITQILLRSGSSTGADTYGKILAYPTNYTNAGLAARFVIEAGTSQQFVFQTNSNFEWRQNSTAIGKLTTTGFYAGSGSAHSTLQSGGSFARAYVAKTANYTLTINDSIVNCTANTFNITLPTAVSITGREYVIKNVGTGVITLNTTSSQTIDGNASGTLTLNQWDSMVVASDGANWIIIK